MNRRQILKGILTVPFVGILPKSPENRFKGKLTDIYLSKEQIKDTTYWTSCQIGDSIIFYPDGTIFGV